MSTITPAKKLNVNVLLEAQKLRQIITCKGLRRFNNFLVNFRYNHPQVEYTIDEFAWGFVRHPALADQVANLLREILIDIRDTQNNPITASAASAASAAPIATQLIPQNAVAPLPECKNIWRETAVDFEKKFAGFSDSLLEPLLSEDTVEEEELPPLIDCSSEVTVKIVTESDFKFHLGSGLINPNNIPSDQCFIVNQDDVWAENIWSIVEPPLYISKGINFTESTVFVFESLFDETTQEYDFRPRCVFDEYTKMKEYITDSENPEVILFVAPITKFDPETQVLIFNKFCCNGRYIGYKNCISVNMTTNLQDYAQQINNSERPVFLYEERTSDRVDDLSPYRFNSVYNTELDTGDIVIYTYDNTNAEKIVSIYEQQKEKKR